MSDKDTYSHTKAPEKSGSNHTGIEAGYQKGWGTLLGLIQRAAHEGTLEELYKRLGIDG